MCRRNVSPRRPVLPAVCRVARAPDRRSRSRPEVGLNRFDFAGRRLRRSGSRVLDLQMRSAADPASLSPPPFLGRNIPNTTLQVWPALRLTPPRFGAPPTILYGSVRPQKPPPLSSQLVS